ncbi:hypothetical protein [Thalassolituus oleivorans]|uniref:Lipoprotein n=1 Tax=Thalassolituus oleivorans MIL-1 TaxID=1298593 RepID=M5DQU3_9GAMM|nr:hypothetical protein [Thalassolituus oleivorans]CCU71811.1 hypothetical protein TOL_1386 [Thalassolituus oleivorans MIL-1]
MLLKIKKYFTCAALIGITAFFGGCGGLEDPAESLIKWKIEGRYDLKYMTKQGVTYSVTSPDSVNFSLNRISPTGEVDWVKNLDLINTKDEVGLATLYLQTGDDGTNRLVVYTSDFKPSTTLKPASTDYHILVLDENGDVRNEILTEGETFPGGNYNYSIDTEIPGLIIRYKNHDLELISESSTITVAMPVSVSDYSIRSVYHTVGGVVAFMDHDSVDTLADKIAYISLSGEIKWIEDAPEMVTVGSQPQKSTYLRTKVENGICEYTLQPFDDTGLQTLSTFSCPESQGYTFSEIEIMGDDIHFAKIFEGLNYTRRDLNTGEIQASYENPVDTSGAHVSSANIGAKYRISEEGQISLPYLVTTEHDAVDLILNAGVHQSYRSGVVILNNDMSIFAEIEFPEYHVYSWLFRCYSWCSDNGDVRSGYDLQDIKIVDDEIYASLRYKEYDKVSGTYTYYYYLAALN